jgi:DNA-binding IclR family transcriptional regulator
MADADGVAAVDRALSILDAFTHNHPKLSLAEISKRTGLYKSTVLRLAKSLEKFGYVHRSQEGSYWLGSKVLFLGSLYQRHFRTSEIVPQALGRIVDELKEAASFYVRDGDHRICLHRVESTRAVRDAVHEGDRLPLTVGASSHVIRAFSGAPGARYEQIRRSMYAASYGERDPETAAVACPVFGVGDVLVGALAVSGPRYRLEALGLDPILPVLFRHAIDLTRILGGNPEALARVAPKGRSRKPQSAKA